jgi:arsenate reductase
MSVSSPAQTRASARPMPVRVLFLCGDNGGRSQMAEGLARLLGGSAIEAASAGGDLGEIHPLAIRVMREVTIDITSQRAQPLPEVSARHFDFIITLSDKRREPRPEAPTEGNAPIAWSFEDPALVTGTDEERLRAFRSVREGLRQRIVLFLLANRITHRLQRPQ